MGPSAVAQFKQQKQATTYHRRHLPSNCAATPPAPVAVSTHIGWLLSLKHWVVKAAVACQCAVVAATTTAGAAAAPAAAGITPLSLMAGSSTHRGTPAPLANVCAAPFIAHR